MEIVEYEDKYKDSLAELFNGFHNLIVSIDINSSLKPFDNKSDVLKYVDKMLKDCETMNGFIYLSLIDGKPVGFIQGVIIDHSKDEFYPLVANPSSQGWVGELYVDSNYRKRGIAKALFKKAKEYLIGCGCDSMRLYVLENNDAARRLYSSLGMKVRNLEMDLSLR